jgi:Domain of unknown function (DUF4380)
VVDKSIYSADTAARTSVNSINLSTDRIGEWFAINISNGLISLSIVPEIGGRLLDLSLGRSRILYSNPRLRGKAIPGLGEGESSRNYGGSKDWPAPQGWSSEGEWPGPPDPVLDCGAYDWRSELAPDWASVHLRSAHDEYAGVTMSRQIKISSGTSSVEVLHTMHNTSQRPVCWSIWQVTQINAEKGLEIFIPATGFHQTFGDIPYTAVSYCGGKNRVRLKYQDQVAKFAVQANQGWFASLDRAGECALAETFPISAGARYPDSAATAFWISGQGTFTLHGDRMDMGTVVGGCDPHVETEIMSPLTELAPGESFEFRTAWHAAAIDSDEIAAVSSAGVVGTPLALTPGSPARFTGSFGVFWLAKLRMIAYDRASRIVGTFDLGDVSPCQPIRLDRIIELPDHTARCSLILFDRNGEQLGVLDRVNVS